jgi:hypothetical protein
LEIAGASAIHCTLAGLKITHWLWIGGGFLGLVNIFQAAALAWSWFGDEIGQQILSRVRWLRWVVHFVYMFFYLFVLARLGDENPPTSNTVEYLKLSIIPALALAAAFASNESLNSSDGTGDKGKRSCIESFARIESIFVAFLLIVALFVLLYLDDVVSFTANPSSLTLVLFTIAYGIFFIGNVILVNFMSYPTDSSSYWRDVWFVIGEVLIALSIHLTAYIQQSC